MEAAKAHWEALCELGKAYHDNLNFAIGASYERTPRKGTWADYLPEMEADLKKLREMASGAAIDACRDADIAPALWADNLPEEHKALQTLEVELDTCGDARPAAAPVLRYRHTNQLEGAFLRADMKLRDAKWTAEIPAQYLTAEWDLLVYFECYDAAGDALCYPGLYHPTEAMPYKIVKIV